MKIIILQGSPNKAGSTSILAEEFTKGAEASGHEVHRFDVAAMNIKSCTGCIACGSPAVTKRTAYPKMAYQLGRALS